MIEETLLYCKRSKMTMVFIWIFLCTGIIYDLFECLAGQMEMNGLTTIPLFFLSPVADRSAFLKVRISIVRIYDVQWLPRQPVIP
jgi:hypothetical protein